MAGLSRWLLFLVGRLGIGIRFVHLRLDVRLLARLDSMLCTWSDLFAAVFLFLLDFFVVGNIAWVCHGVPCGH